MAARGLDRDYVTSGWFALVFAVLSVLLLWVIGREPPPEMSMTLMSAVVLASLAVFSMVAAKFYRRRLPRIVAETLDEPGSYLAGWAGMVPMRVPVFTDGGYPLVLACVSIGAVAAALIGGAHYLLFAVLFLMPSATASALVGAAWAWRREGREISLARLALTDEESLPSMRDLKAWARLHRQDDTLLPEPPPLYDAVPVTEHERAVFERELELATRLRRGWLWLVLCLTAAAVLAIHGLYSELLKLGLVLVVQGLLVLPCVLYVHDRYLEQIRKQPRLFAHARVKRYHSTPGQTGVDPMERIGKILMFLCVFGAGAYGVMAESSPPGWAWGLASTAVLPFAAFYMLDTIIWRQAAWRELSEHLSIEVEGLMQKLGWHWSWVRGWQKYGMN